MKLLSVVILTFNEEKNIERCIKSVLPLTSNVTLIDSYSSDNTQELASKLGVKIIEKEFEGFIKQRVFSIESASTDYVLALDGDEWLSQELQDEIKDILQNWTHDCYELNRLSRIGKKWIKHSKWFPDYKIRLLKRGTARCSGKSPHDTILANPGSQTKKLKGILYHHANDDFQERLTTINSHATVAAQYLFDQDTKANIFRIVGKPFFRFWIQFLIRGGFRDGYLGLFVCISDSFYVFQREIKLYELYKIKNGRQDGDH